MCSLTGQSTLKLFSIWVTTKDSSNKKVYTPLATMTSINLQRLQYTVPCVGYQ